MTLFYMCFTDMHILIFVLRWFTLMFGSVVTVDFCTFYQEITFLVFLVGSWYRWKNTALTRSVWCDDLVLVLEEQRSDGEDGVKGQSFGEHHSDSIHQQQIEVQLRFFYRTGK